MTKTSNLIFTAVSLCLPLVAVAASRTVVANDVVINGESFFAASNIRDELNRLARRDSVIGPTESFRQIAVSGAVLSQILGFYRDAAPKPKYLISDGGGNDLMSACPSPATAECPTVKNAFATVKVYFDSMRAGGTEKVLWMRYPDPQGANWATLKTNQDLFNPLVKALCDTIQKPKCLWIDLRPVWEGHYAQYTSDGIHATNAGGTATAEAFWKVLVDSNFFDLDPTAIARARERAQGFEILPAGSGAAGISVRFSDPGPHAVRVHDAAGREVARLRARGAATLFLPGTRNPGLYIVHVSGPGGAGARKVLVRP